MSDPIKYDFTRCRLSLLNSVLPRVPVEDDVQFRNLGDPAAINLSIKFNGELHQSQLSTWSTGPELKIAARFVGPCTITSNGNSEAALFILLFIVQ